MSICTFFGHRLCPATLEAELRSVLRDLIECHGVDTFYVGNQGAFDGMALAVLRELAHLYPQITYTVVLAYLPSPQINGQSSRLDFSNNTIYPEGIETVPQRFAIDWRNRWLLKQADYVVTYVTHSWGGAAKFAGKAKQMRKVVIELAE